MVGHAIALYLRENGVNVDTLSAHRRLDRTTSLTDVRDTDRLERILNGKKFEVVVNCVGLLVKESEEKPDLAIYLNSYLPRFLENHFKRTSTKVITIGTDGVFSKSKSSHTEVSRMDGESFYARTKALGEIDNDKDLTFRTSVVGPELDNSGVGLFGWFWSQTGKILGYTDAMWSGITSVELAKAVLASIEQNVVGIRHLVPKNSISKFELLGLFKKVFQRDDIELVASSGTTNGANLVNTRKDFQYPIPEYETMICEMKDWIESHPDIYAHYGR